jgi:hypothetical protein
MDELAPIMLASSIGGTLARIPVFPLDTIKARMQALEQLPHRNALDLLVKVYRQEGFKSLFSGLPIAVLGSGPAGCIYFTSYELSKTYLARLPYLREHQSTTHFVAGMLAGM